METKRKSVETASRWEQKEQEMLERLLRQTESYQAVFDALSSISKDQDPDQVDEELSDLFQSLLEETPVDTQKAFQRYLEMDEEEYGGDRWEKERELLQQYPEVMSLSQIYRALEQKKDFFTRLRRYEGPWNSKMKSAVDRELSKRGISTLDIESIEINAFDVVIKMKGLIKASQAGKSERGGFAVQNTPFIFLATQDEISEKEALLHERTHAFLDRAGLESQSNMANVMFLTIREYKDNMRADEETQNRYEKQLTSLQPAIFLDANHEEFLAELKNAEAKGFIDQQTFEELGSTKATLEERKTIAIKNVFSTAGQDVYASLVHMTKAMGDEELPQHIRDHLEKLRAKTIDLFLKTIEFMKNALEIAEKISPEAKEFVHFAFVTFPPSKYRHVEKVLGKKYGKGAVDNAKRRLENE